MSVSPHYLTNEQGERVGVLLDMEEYRCLMARADADPDLLSELNPAELEALAQSVLSPAAQSRLDELLARHDEQRLSPEETAELDRLLEQVDQLNVLKTRARYTLKQREAGTGL